MIFNIIWIIIFLIIIYYAIRKFFDLIIIKDLSKCPILISGCDTGFGFELTLKCINNRIPVFAGCLTQEGINELKRIAEKTLKVKFLHPILLDVTKSESIEKAKSYIEKELLNQNYIGLHALVNNAGIIGRTAFDDWLSLADYENVLQVNSLGVIRLTHAFKNLIKKNRGRIITTTSVCGRVALPAFGPYSVSKYAIEAYCDTIRLELSQFGVKVSILEPGFFKTPLTNFNNIENMLNNVWNNLSENVRESYGEKYFAKVKEYAQCQFTQTSPNTELVVNAYYHAICGVYPRKRYVIGFDAFCGFVPFSYLSTDIQDIIFKIYFLIKNFPTVQK